MARGAISVSLDDAQRIIDRYHPSNTVSRLVQLPHTPDTKSYILDLISTGTSSPQCCILTLSAPSPPTSTPQNGSYHPNTLPTSSHLFSLVAASTTSPPPTPPPTLDTSLAIVPHHFLLSPVHPFPAARVVPLHRARARLSERDKVVIDVRLGQFFGQVHSRVQNEWFGLPVSVSPSPSNPPSNPTPTTPTFTPTPAPDDTSYSWQETFTALLEDLLSRVHANPAGYRLPALPFHDIRRHLSRAIGSFLFDDVDVPALVWFTGSEEDVYVVGPFTSTPPPPPTSLSAPPSPTHVPEPKPAPTPPSTTNTNSTTTTTTITTTNNNNNNNNNNNCTNINEPLVEPDTANIAFILPSFTHALWGDPLLESILLPSPSAAFMEGYTDAGGAPLIVFPRQRTKRIWYTVFLALVVLTGYGPVGTGEGEEGGGEEEEEEEEEGEEEWVKEKRRWARETLMSCVEKLKDAPCY